MNLNSIQFNVQSATKAGNPYNKTRLGKVAGSAIGGTTAALIARNCAKRISNPTTLRNAIELVGKDGTRELIGIAKKVAGIKAGVAILAGIGIGAIIDLCVNKARRAKADKADKALMA